MSNQEFLRSKAILICEHCVTVGLPQPQYRIVSEYAVDLLWYYEGKKHVMSLYFKPSQQQWTVTAKTDWVKQTIEPAVQSLFGLGQAMKTSLPVTHLAEQKQLLTLSTPQVYFKDALTCLSLLAPFSHDNIDFSAICDRTREAVKRVLSDPTFSHIDQAMLQVAIDTPNKSDFSGAKEYLTLCLTLCNINNAVN